MTSTYLSQKKCELLVNGYIHNEYDEEIPAEIIRLCLIFYHRKHKAIEIDETTNIMLIMLELH